MPVRWTPDNDQHLLLKILETCNVAIDYAAIANAWDIGEEKPTPKAISERIAKLKRLSKGSGTITTDKGPSTPRKSKDPAAGKNTPKSRTPAKTPKRKRVEEVRQEPEDDDDEDEDEELPIPIKVEAEAEAETDESPTKRVRTVEGTQEFTDEDKHDSFDDEFSLGPHSDDDKVGGYDGAGEYMTPDEMSEFW